MTDTFTKADIQKAQKAWEALPATERQLVDSLVAKDILKPMMDARMSAACQNQSTERAVNDAFKANYPSKEVFDTKVAKLRNQHTTAKDYTYAILDPKVKYGLYMSDFTSEKVPLARSDSRACIGLGGF